MFQDRVRRDVAAEIKDRVSITDAINMYCVLPKRIGAKFRMACPLHNGKDANFSVDTRRDTFNCFVCGQHGDIFTLVMGLFGIDFPSAVRKLNKDFNLSLPIDRKATDEELFHALQKDNERREWKKAMQAADDAYVAAFEALIDAEIKRDRTAPVNPDGTMSAEWVAAVSDEMYYRYAMEQAEVERGRLLHAK